MHRLSLGQPLLTHGEPILVKWGDSSANPIAPDTEWLPIRVAFREESEFQARVEGNHTW